MLAHKTCDAFLAVAETGSFEQAALKLCITASAVTLRVQNLEKQLGQCLIIRERPCRITHSGQQLLEFLQQQRLKEQDLLQQLSGSKQQNFYTVKVATNADSLETWLLPSLKESLITQNITLQLQIDDQSTTHELLEKGLVSACISSEKIQINGCQRYKLGAMRYVLACTPTFKEKWFPHGIQRDLIKSAPAIIFNAKDHLHANYIQSLFGLNIQSYPYFFIPSSHMFVQSICMGLGFGLIPELQIQQELEQGLLVELLAEHAVQLDLYWYCWKQQSSILQQLTTQILDMSQSFLVQA